MKKTIDFLLVLVCSFPYFLWAQAPPLLSNPSACQLGLPIVDDNCPEDSPTYQPNIFDIQVNDAPGIRLGEDVYLKEVRLIIRHAWLNDLDITLESPGGRSVELSSDNGGGENDYGNPDDINCDSAAVFRNNACLSVVQAVPPYLEVPIRPEEHFYNFNDSITDPNGTWKLIICDDVDEDAGSLEFIHLVFEPISCLPIQEISSLTVDSTTAIVNLSPEGACGITIFEYGPPGFQPGIDSTAGTEGQTLVFDGCAPFSLTGLPELSNLDLYVRRYCLQNGTFSGNTCGNSLTTGCRPPTVTIETTFAAEQQCTTTCSAPCPLNGLWRNAPGADFDWIVNSGPVPTQGTGPISDANGDGNYVYLETSGSSCPSGSTARLLSACMELDLAGSDTCHFSFNYHMYGNSIGTLRLEITLDGGFTWQHIWERSGDQGNQWNKEYLSLAGFPEGSLIQLRFVAEKGAGFRGDIALDHLVFYGSKLLGYPDQPFYVDQDDDGYGSGEAFILSCLSLAPAGYTDNNLDCNDNNPAIHPNLPEIPCNSVDENCNGLEDDTVLPSAVSSNDTICSGEIPEICAPASEGFLTAWYDSPDLETLVSIGPCFSPDLPPNNSPNTVVYTYYVIETNFTCASAVPTQVDIHVRPQPKLRIENVPEICPTDTFDLAALNITDENFTNSDLTYHFAIPTAPDNQLTNLLIPAARDTVIYAKMRSTEGCSDEISVPLLVSPGPEISFSPADSFILCKESSTVVEAAVQNGNGAYQYFWDNGRTTPQITIEAGNTTEAVGIYALTVTDSNGCLNTDSVVVQTSNSIDSLFRRVTNAISCQGSEGQIALSPLTGLSPFTYQWSSTNGISGTATSTLDTFVIDNLSQGAYRITITDNSSQQCAFFLRNVLVQGPGAVVQAINIEPTSCGGAADGRIELDVIGNNPVYNWSNGADTPTVNQLSGDSFSVTITDGSCSTVLTDLQVFEPEPLGFRVNTTATSCAGSSDGQLNLEPFGGDGVYTLNWDTGLQSFKLSNLAGGYYAFTITDGNNCSLTDSVLVGSPAPLSVQLDSLAHLRCFESNDGYLQVSGQGGTPPYQYRWEEGNTIPARFNLDAGSFTLTITDFAGCTATQTFELQQPEILELNLTDLSPPLCEGVPNGAIQLEAVGGSGNYSFEWTDGITVPNRANLPIGLYEVIVRDENACASNPLSIPLLPEEVLDPGIDISLPACVGPATGSISLSPIGTEPFTANWSTGTTGLQLTDIPTGNYGLTLTDDRGCRLDSLITLDAPQEFELDLIVDDPSCFGVTDGIVQVLITKTGTPPFDFLWSDGSTERDRSTLGAGKYQLTLSDDPGCEFVTDTITLSQPEPLNIAAFDIGQVACKGESGGYIEVDITGGTEPYDINWLGQGVTSPGIYEIPSGDYRLQVFDAQNCPIDTTFRITEPDFLVVDVELTQGDPCDAGQTNTLRASANGGTPPYRYNWSNGTSDPIILDAAPDDYSLTVTDARGCRDIIRSIKVRPRDFALSLDTFYVKGISCFGAADASMTAEVSGGSGLYTYLFRPALLFENTRQDSITVSNLSLHNQYAVTITDANTGCRISSTALTISEPAPLSIQLDHVQAVNCVDGTDGVLRVDVSGGTPPYTYNWVDSSGGLISESEDLENVGKGVYQLTLTDANACTISYVDSIAVRYPDIELIDTSVQAVACFGEASGAIDITVSGGQSPFQFQWDNGATTEDLSDISAGLYSLTLTDANSCTAIFPNLEIPQNGELLESETITTPVSCFGAADGAVRVVIDGGTPPYHFDWFRNGQPIANMDTAQLNDIPAGRYTLEFNDSQGCNRTFELEVDSPPDLQINLQINVPKPPGFNNGGASVMVSGGQPDYIYQWSNGDTTAAITDLSTGTYGLTVTDSAGCQDSVSLTLTDLIDRQLIRTVRLFPNPANDLALLELTFPQAVAAQLFVLDAFGKKMFRQNLPKQLQHEVPIDTRYWPPGMYQIGITYRGRIVFSERLLVVR